MMALADAVVRRTLTEPAAGAGRAWSRFWFTPVRSSSYVVWRTALAVAVGCWLASLAPDLVDLYGESGLQPEPRYTSYRWGLMRWFTSDVALYSIWVVTAVATTLVGVGRLVRVGAPVMFVGVMSFTSDNADLLNAGDELLRIWCAYFAVYALLTPNRVLEARPAADGVRPLAPAWLMRLVQIQLTIVYPFTAIAKFRGDAWLDGTASLLSLGLVDFERFPVPDALTDSLAFGAAATWGTLAVEMSLPYLLWTRRTRRFAVVLGVGLHVGFDYALRVGFFGWAMIVGYAAFLAPDEADRVIRWTRHPLIAGRGLASALRGGEEAAEQQDGAGDKRHRERGHLVEHRVEGTAGREHDRAGGEQDVGEHEPAP